MSAHVLPRRLLLVGSVLVDVVLFVPKLPPRGGDLLVRRAFMTPGGGFNLLYAATRLGLPAAYGGQVGTGMLGRLVAERLADLGVPVLLPPVPDADTGFDVALVEADGERTFVTAPGCEARLSREALAALPLAPGDAVYVSGYDLVYEESGAALAAVLPGLPESSLLVLDPGPLVAEIPAERLAEVLPRVDLLSLNAREAALLTGEEQGAEAAAVLLQRIARGGVVVVRVGAEGAFLATSEGALAQVPPRPARAIDTTGAGDTHTAALLAARQLGCPWWESVWVANIAASLSVEVEGPASAPDRASVEAEIRRLRGEPWGGLSLR
jgi:sugar/nucleoside kinase (ribokinase family)